MGKPRVYDSTSLALLYKRSKRTQENYSGINRSTALHSQDAIYKNYDLSSQNSAYGIGGSWFDNKSTSKSLRKILLAKSNVSTSLHNIQPQI